jgi:hypothetical protein
LCAKLGRVRRIKAPDGALYLERFALWGSTRDDPGPTSILGINVWLHRIHLPDGDRDLHNHPWHWARAVILNGWYTEERAVWGIRLQYVRKRWDTYKLTPSDYHRITGVSQPLWTIFITGRETPEKWGFLTQVGHVDSREYLATRGEDADGGYIAKRPIAAGAFVTTADVEVRVAGRKCEPAPDAFPALPKLSRWVAHEHPANALAADALEREGYRVFRGATTTGTKRDSRSIREGQPPIAEIGEVDVPLSSGVRSPIGLSGDRTSRAKRAAFSRTESATSPSDS